MNESVWKIEEQFRSMFQFADMSMVLIKNEGIIAQGNPAFQNLFGYTDDEIKKLYFSNLFHPKCCAKSMNLF